jgi:hypothetical protein
VLAAADGFRALSPTHVLILGLFVVGAVVVLAWARSHRDGPSEKRDRRVFAAAILLGLGMRPTWRSYWFTIAVTGSWALAAYCFNLVAGTDYGYLNRKPDSASVLDALGPWPWYVLAEIAIVFVEGSSS